MSDPEWPIEGPPSFDESIVGQEILRMAHRATALEVLSELLRRDRQGDHILSDEEYNAIAYAIDRVEEVT